MSCPANESGPVRIGIIDSGVHASHPHVNGVAGGVSITAECGEESDYLDTIGHGTAVTAAICEKAPDAALYAVRIFHRRLSTRIEPLVYAIDWCVRHQMHFINLSLGTANPAHEPLLRAVVDRVRAAGIILVTAHGFLPGDLPGVCAVELDWDCPRDRYRTTTRPDGSVLYRASGYPRPVPGVAPEQNLKGISFAVANVTGLLARGA